MGEIVYELTWIDLVLCIVKQLFFYVVIDGGVIAVILFSPKMKKWSKVVCSILTAGVLIVICIIQIRGSWQEYNRLQEAYAQKNYYIVAGPIERYGDGLVGVDKNIKDFWIGDVYFSYNDFDNTVSYHQTQGMRNVIKGNGQMVCICYVVDQGINKIIMIVQLPEKVYHREAPEPVMVVTW